MARYLRSGIAVLLLVCFVSQACCHLETVKVLNHADTQKYSGCDSLLRAGYNVSGVYMLTLNGKDVQIPCEFVGGTALTVILRRVSNGISFAQPWYYYENGFGNPEGNYWAGLENIYSLTSTGYTTLIINMQDWTQGNINAVYSEFYLGGPSTKYRLHAGAYSGTLPDDLSYQNNMPFATVDDPDPNNCATNLNAGWWYNYCAYTLPTGHYYTGGWYTPTGTTYDGIYWKDWYGLNYSLQYISMTLSTES